MADEKISLNDFKKIQLKVGKILEATPHPNADKLIVLQDDLGQEKRQLVAGIKPWYKPEDLVGKCIAVVANLQPATLRGVESQGMLLAATDTATNNVKILVVDGEVSPGSVIS